MKAFIASVLAAAMVTAQHDDSAPLTKPTLVDSLDYLEQGLADNLPQTAYTATEWTNDQIPQSCLNIANDNSQAPTDFRIFDIAYEDCSDQPWVFCYHQNSEITIDSMATQFGKLPIQMRQYIRHVVTIPADGGSAYNSDANIVFFRPVDNMMRVFVHETGHTLDAQAYVDGGLTPSDNWWDNYNQDANSIDGYGSTNMVEEVAQAHVLSVFNENVPGQYAGIEPNAGNVFHQYATVITAARDHGAGKTLLTPGLGDGQSCTHHNPPSETVPKTAAAKRSRRESKRVVKKDTGCTLTF